MKISIKGITKEYRNINACVKALDNVDLEFDGAELVLITGENGCGTAYEALEKIGVSGKVAVVFDEEK